MQWNAVALGECEYSVLSKIVINQNLSQRPLMQVLDLKKRRINMTASEIVAYIGAAAWIPQAIRWGYHYYSIPDITVIPDRIIQIG